MTTLPRQSHLSGAACVGTGAAANTIPAHPDAELLAAWSGYAQAWRDLDALPISADEEQLEPYYAVKDGFGDHVERIAARTLAGLRIKIQYLLTVLGESRMVEQHLFHGRPWDRSETDFRHEMLRAMIGDIEKMGV